jgi:NADPH2:quinone reductase
MRAAVVSEVGEPPRPGEFPDPSAGEGQALVEVTAASLNPIEIRVAAGRHPQRPRPPYVPGAEGVGRLDGRRVRFETALPGFGAHGALAELAAADEESLFELPDGVDDATAAAIGTVGITALLALDRAALRKGETVLVLAATGAVGQMAVQLARVRGAGRVVAAGRNADRLRRVAELGADATVELGSGELGEADVIVDPLWGEPAVAALNAAAVGARLVNVGQAAGGDTPPPLAALRNKQAAILGLSSGWAQPGAKRDAYRRVLDHVLAGDVVMDHDIVPLDQVADAWRRQAASPGRKLVITP